MFRIKTLVLLALTSTACFAHAQTGPTGPVNPPSNPAVQPGPSANLPANMLHADRLANFLRGQGIAVEQKRYPNGAVSLLTKIEREGWRYEVEIEYSLDQKSLTFLVPLSAPGAQYSNAQLLDLLKASWRLCPAHFCYRAADNRLCLEDPLYFTTNWNEQGFQQCLDRILKIVRDTHSLWGASQPSNVPTASPVPSVPTVPSVPVSPTASQTPAVPAIPQGIGQGEFVGSETLGGYGKLTFQFSGANQVVMIDKDGKTTGTYTMQGNTVVIRFTYSNGAAVVYTGTLNGNTLSGTATNGASNWQFTVSKS